MLRKQIGVVLLVVLLLAAVMGWKEAKKPGRFPLQEVVLLGVKHAQIVQTLPTIGVDKGVNIWEIDLQKVHDRIESLPWVRSVRLKRLLPSTLVIRVMEKVAVSMSKEDDQLVLLDEYGMVIKPLEANDTLIAPVIIPARGDEPAAKVVWLTNLLAKHAWLRGRISEAVGLPGGRWTLYTKRGVKLLFSKHTDQEMELLKRLQEQYTILDRKIRQVELRIPGRVAVRSAL